MIFDDDDDVTRDDFSMMPFLFFSPKVGEERDVSKKREIFFFWNIQFRVLTPVSFRVLKVVFFCLC